MPGISAVVPPKLCRAGCLLLVALFACCAVEARTQDGASYDPHAKKPPITDQDRPESPQMMSALSFLWHGEVDKAIPALTALSEGGNIEATLMLGNLYVGKSRLPVAANPAESLRFFRMASTRGSGEASEQIAEMIEHHEVLSQTEGDASTWRALAVKQGWIQQELTTHVFTWTHGSEPLHCDAHPVPPEVVEKIYKGHPPEECPLDSEIATLRSKGLTGSLRSDGGGTRYREGPKARAILIMDHSVPSEEDLRQPYATSVIYIQTLQDRWRMLPTNTPLLERYMVLEPNAGGPGRSGMATQDVDGSSTGGAVGPPAR